MPNTHYDSRGRQLNFEETEVQRLEREAFGHRSAGSRSGSSSPALSSSPLSSGCSTPRESDSPKAGGRRQLIQEPFDPIELMANRLAEEYFSLFSSEEASDEEFLMFTAPPPPPEPSMTRGSKRSHRQKRASLSSIPEED